MVSAVNLNFSNSHYGTLYTRGRIRPLTYHECLNQIVWPHKDFFPDDTCRIIKDPDGGFMVRTTMHIKKVY